MKKKKMKEALPLLNSEVKQKDMQEQVKNQHTPQVPLDPREHIFNK